MSSSLLTFSVGPVHEFIGQARRVADLWAGSQILSELTRGAIGSLLEDPSCSLIFPAVKQNDIPAGLPNRFVARVPSDRAGDTAKRLAAVVASRWQTFVEHAGVELARLQFDCSGLIDENSLWRQAIQCSWSWTEETGTYEHDSRAAAELYAASRVFRPFDASNERGIKCAICGERNALPGSDRNDVIRDAWQRAEEIAEGQGLKPFVRRDQSRLCAVCAARRFYPTLEKARDRRAIFDSFESFQPDDERSYFALVTMDGDRLGEALGNSTENEQAEISRILSRFANDLRTGENAELNLTKLGIASPSSRTPPQLIYAGGEDVLFISDPRDAIECAVAIRKHFCQQFQRAGRELTISAAVVFAHTKIPAGRLLRIADDLLKRRAKATWNAIAVALHKRSGPAVETVFPWEGDVPIGTLQAIAKELEDRHLASRQTYDLRDESRVLTGLFSDGEWQAWLRWRLSRGERSHGQEQRLADLLAPLFTGSPQRIGALRIARFLAVEVAARKTNGAAP